jgi:hypothetical protein
MTERNLILITGAPTDGWPARVPWLAPLLPDQLSMTHHVECVALREPAAKGS